MSHEIYLERFLAVSELMNAKETEMYRELRQSPSVRKPKPLTLMDHQTKQKC